MNYLVVKNNNTRKSYELKTTHTGPSFLRVNKTNYLDLTTNTTNNIKAKIKVGNSTFRPLQSTSSQYTKTFTTGYSGKIDTTITSATTSYRDIISNLTTITGYSNNMELSYMVTIKDITAKLINNQSTTGLMGIVQLDTSLVKTTTTSSSGYIPYQYLQLLSSKITISQLNGTNSTFSWNTDQLLVQSTYSINNAFYFHHTFSGDYSSMLFLHNKNTAINRIGYTLSSLGSYNSYSTEYHTTWSGRYSYTSTEYTSSSNLSKLSDITYLTTTSLSTSTYEQ